MMKLCYPHDLRCRKTDHSLEVVRTLLQEVQNLVEPRRKEVQRGRDGPVRAEPVLAHHLRIRHIRRRPANQTTGQNKRGEEGRGKERHADGAGLPDVGYRACVLFLVVLKRADVRLPLLFLSSRCLILLFDLSGT